LLCLWSEIFLLQRFCSSRGKHRNP